MDATASSRHLLLFESQELVGRLITHRKPKLSKPAVAQRARTVSAYVRQGRQLMEISINSDPIVRPILQYYGLVALCRGLIVVHAGAAPDSLEPAHGAAVKLPARNDMADARVVLSNDGTIPGVIPILEQFSQFNIEHWSGYEPAVGIGGDGVPSINRVTKYSPFGGNLRLGQAPISAEQLLARIPEIEEEYSAAFQRDPCYVPCRVVRSETSGNVEIVADKPLDHESGQVWQDASEFSRVFGIPKDFNVRRFTDHPLLGIGPGMSMMSVEHDDARPWPALYSSTEVSGHVVQRRTVLIRPVNGLSLSPLTLMLLASFMLSSVARYHPEEWRATILGAENDRLLPVTRRLMDVIDQQLVNCIAIAYGQHHRRYHIDSTVDRVLPTVSRSNAPGSDASS